MAAIPSGYSSALDHWEIRLDDGILELTMNRPEKRNALTLLMERESVFR